MAEATHAGEDFISKSGQAYDVTGGERAFGAFWNLEKFEANILRHVRKTGKVKTVIDLTGASKAQVQAVKGFVDTLTKEQQQSVMYINGSGQVLLQRGSTYIPFTPSGSGPNF